MSFVYISYGPPDEELARYLQVQLEEAGYTAWLDEVREIDETMVSVLRSAIASAGAFIAVGGAGLGYPELVKWEIGIASQNGIPILALRSAADIASILASLENLFEKPSALIPLPVPMRWEAEQPTHRYRIGRIGWLILLTAVLLGAIWLVRIAILTPTETSEETLPAPTAVPTELILATETSVPSVTPPPTTAPSATTAASPTVGLTPSETPSPTWTASPTLTLTQTASPTITPSPSPTSSPTATPSPTASPTRTPTASATPTVTATPTATPTATQTASPTPLVWPTAAPGEKWLTNTPAPGL